MGGDYPMIRITGDIPIDCTVACSGGPDSMAILHFLNSGRKNVRIAHFNHGTDHGEEATEFIQDYANENSYELIMGNISETKPTSKSWEEWWRDCRYNFFKTIPGKVITAHHLDDVAEWWLFSSLHGLSRLIPSRRENVLRPFLCTPKSSLMRWCKKHNVPYVVDPTNEQGPHARATLRKSVMPGAYMINPGLRTVLKKKLLAREENEKR